jgi:Icc-related predicted phosphoesterase
MAVVKVLSDTHNDHDQIIDTECDILIHCGDFSTKGNYTECRAFLEWFVKQPAKYKLVVPGNHDKAMKKSFELISLSKEYGIIVLNNGSTNIMGLNIYGHSYVPFFKENAFGEIVCRDGNDRSKRKQVWSKIPEGLDILVTHAPPQKILDANKEGIHCGCVELRDRVLQAKPKYHFFGHIHEHAQESVSIGSTTFVNCANKDRSYFLTHISPKKFDI